MRYLIAGTIASLALLAILEWYAPWQTARVPTPSQHSAAISAGWIEGTDGYYRFIYGIDAY
jgi:hypothetical protein